MAESSDRKVNSQRVSTAPLTECAGCVTLKADIKELKAENKELKAENKELKADIKELKAENKELKADIKELKADIKELKADIVELKEQMTNLMNHVRPINDIRLRVLLSKFRDYIEERLGKKPAELCWTKFLTNVANDSAKLGDLEVSSNAVQLLAGEFKVLSQSAHEAFAVDIREAIDTERVEWKRLAYSEIFQKIFRTG